MDQVVKQATFNLLEPLKQNYGTVRNFVDGEWAEPKTDRCLDIMNPAGGTAIGKVPLTTKIASTSPP
jgi:hypothetical protein